MSAKTRTTRGERIWALDVAMIVCARMAQWRAEHASDLPAGTFSPDELTRAYEVLFTMSLQEQARGARR